MEERTTSFGELQGPTWVDRFGVWLSAHRVGRIVPDLNELDVADLGCGYKATFAMRVADDVRSVVVVDRSLSAELAEHPKVRAIEGGLPQAVTGVPSESFDLIMMMSVLEHLTEPDVMLAEVKRLLRPGGVAIVNVPTWLGKRFLEFSAFRLGLSPREEMDDHKRYYDPRDLWPLLIEAGFPPHGVKCRRHKFGLNTFAVCRLDPTGLGGSE